MVRALIRHHEFDIVGTQEGFSDFRKSRFALLGKGDFWLSETPDRPSFGWDARCCHRLVSWARLRDRSSSRVLFVFSLHFDHEGELARRASADLVLRKIAEIARGEPAICVGDFNSTPDTVQIRTMSKAMRDARQASKTAPYGPAGTFNGFRFDRAPAERIDYIFVDRHFDVRRYAALSDSLDQRYPSDHFPVVARVVFN